MTLSKVAVELFDLYIFSLKVSLTIESLTSFIDLPTPTPNSNPSWFGFPITLKDDCGFKREELTMFLNSNKIGLLDYAMLPFIRQFRNVDIDWFENLNLSFLNNWYLSIVESKAFFDIMKKYKVWDAEDKPIITNFNYN